MPLKFIYLRVIPEIHMKSANLKRAPMEIYWKPKQILREKVICFFRLCICLLIFECQTVTQELHTRTPQDMDGRLKGIFSKLETSRNMKK